MRGPAHAIFCLCCLLLSACHANGYKVEGTAEGIADGDTLLVSSDMIDGIPFDTLVVKDGKFGFKGVTDSVRLCMLYSQRTLEVSSLFFIEPGKIKVRLSPTGSRVSGTRINDEWQQLTDSMAMYGTEVNQLLSEYYGGEVVVGDLSVEERIGMLTEKLSRCIYRAAERNIGNEFGYFLVIDGSLDDADQITLIGKMPKRYRERQEIRERLEDLMVQDTGD